MVTVYQWREGPSAVTDTCTSPILSSTSVFFAPFPQPAPVQLRWRYLGRVCFLNNELAMQLQLEFSKNKMSDSEKQAYSFSSVQCC